MPLQASDMIGIATIIVGVGAIIGAVFVGIRQAGIASRQADILASQVRLEETKLKADLFDKRLATYEATAAFLYHIGDLGDTAEGEARISHFATKYRESRFLFGADVHAALMEIWEKGNEIRVARAISISNFEEKLPRDPNHSLQITSILTWSLQRAGMIHELFQPYLELDAQSLRITS